MRQSHIVDALYICTNHVNLKKYIKLGKGEKNKGANEAIISNSFEAFRVRFIWIKELKLQRIFLKKTYYHT